MRKIIMLVIAAALAAAALAVPAAASTGHAARCSLAYTSSHTAGSVTFKFSQTCGLSYRAWLDSPGGVRYGTYRKCPGCSSPYSVACVSPATCTGGGLIDGGYQSKSTGRMTCTVSCARAHTTALAAAGPPPQCTSGDTNWSVDPRLSATTWFRSGALGRSHPVACEQLRIEATSKRGEHEYSRWIANQGFTTTATLLDGSGVANARQERRVVGSTSVECRYVTSPDSWHPCGTG